ncbi:Cobalamin-independent synthase, Catalytic domain [Bhargavaea ginsengi]|uniref:Cobalamin-independent synthase, Catalytic domain n=1 Tax=Bhargavaea ginsengi TaxID=426757 RepID=A0A1H7B3Y5_9BACL|nr:5-methyltetrahydropteroyltriglutamate--homocysteine S-methyltransferase [Bhargavaea ginsengi]SEJ71624.1 Cobalamin-independent synthase, Catalytic domain [Bhargavaea ginsengi]
MTANLPETKTVRTPFKADHVGSFLRPERLKKVREQFKDGSITREELTLVEDEEINKLVKAQLENGLTAVTDGEFRRTWWHMDFLLGLDGIEYTETGEGIPFNGVKTKAHGYKVTGKIGYSGNHPFLDHFRKLQKITGDGVKVKYTIPSPNMLFFHSGIETDLYQNGEDFYKDLIPAYRAFIKDLYDAGCRYLQLDDTAWSLFFSEESRDLARAFGSDPDQLVHKFAEAINGAIEGWPDNLLVTMHICRGNFRSSYASSGSYEGASEVIFSKLNVDGLFLEFDDERSGGFEPLRFVNRPDLTIVLGLVTSKFPELEDEEQIKARIREAATFVPLSQLALSPQCGFASTEEGNILTEEEQWAKVRHVAKIAKDVWGPEA